MQLNATLKPHLRRPADARQALLDAIAAKKDDGEVIAALRKLAEQNPTPAPARSPKIFGRWKLLWASSNAEARLMRPRREADSMSLADHCTPLQSDRSSHLLQATAWPVSRRSAALVGR